MDWSSVRRCRTCGAGCPADARKCIRCNSRRLGCVESPPTPTDGFTLDTWSLPSEYIARLFGFKDLRLGWQSHWCWEPEQRKPGNLLISALWSVEVRPAFSPPAALCGIFFSDGPYHLVDAAKCYRFAFVVPKEHDGNIGHSIVLDRDPFPAAFKSIDLTEDDGSQIYDGVYYDIHFRTWSCTVDLRLDNPRMPSHKEVERVIFSLASSIAEDCATPELREYMMPEEEVRAKRDHERALKAAVSDADEAFRSRDYALVVRLLAPFEVGLAKVPRAKLALARKRQ